MTLMRTMTLLRWCDRNKLMLRFDPNLNVVESETTSTYVNDLN